jgi:pimeloyl-ACP methyl ester carboxylesterase
MSGWLRRTLSVIAATALLLGVGTATGAVGQAEEAVLIPGATVFKRINPLYPIIATTYPNIGIHFHHDDHPRVVDYSQNALASDRAIADGVEKAEIAVREVDGQVVVIGESMGSMVAWRLAKELASSAEPPSKNDIRFVLIAPPEAGMAEYFKEGTFIPVLNYRVSRIPELPYDTTVVIGEYDGWADPPDRPWNLVALFNAVAGMAFVHGPKIASADPADVPNGNTTVEKNSLGATVTTHFVRTENLPLTDPLRLIGIPDKIVDRADRVLRPIIDAGYRRHDKPGDTRPYLADGEIHRNVQSQQAVREQSQEAVEDKPADRQQRRKVLLDRIESPVEQLTTKIDESRVAEVSAESESGRPEQP